MTTWLTVQQAADRIGRHPGTVRRMCERSELVGEKCGSGSWRIDSASLDVWQPARPKVLTIAISPDELSVVRQLAQNEGATPADLVRRVVSQYLEHQEVASPA